MLMGTFLRLRDLIFANLVHFARLGCFASLICIASPFFAEVLHASSLLMHIRKIGSSNIAVVHH